MEQDIPETILPQPLAESDEVSDQAAELYKTVEHGSSQVAISADVNGMAVLGRLLEA